MASAGDKLAGNVSLEGGLGIISSVGTGYYENRKFIDKELNAKPFGSENFYSTRGLRAVIEMHVKFVATCHLA